MHKVVTCSRKRCHLCDTVRETLMQVQSVPTFNGAKWRSMAITYFGKKHNDEVPVVFIDGRKAFKYRIEWRQFLRALAGMA